MAFYLGLCHVGGGSKTSCYPDGVGLGNRSRPDRLRGRLNSDSIKCGSLQLAWNGKLVLVDGALLITSHSSPGSSAGAVTIVFYILLDLL